jgi:drug/metabolite transporter (DMT)-like permease
MPSASSSSSPAPRGQVLLAYGVLYVVWGSTYLAMKLAVQSLPPFTTAALRFVFSGLLLLGIGLVVDKTPLTRRHLLSSVSQGLFLLVLGNGGVMWAMKTVPSGVGALIIATTPLFMALLSRDFRTITWVGIVLGMVGIGVLVDPFSTTKAAPTSGVVLLLCASFAWAIGSLLPRRFPPHPSNLVATGIQMLTGAVIQFFIGRLLGEHIAWEAATSTSWLALAYLAVFGSLVGFTCYGWLLKVEPASRVSTYAYVNPVVAVVLGAVVGGEEVGGRVAIAAAVIVVAVVLILRGKKR